MVTFILSLTEPLVKFSLALQYDTLVGFQEVKAHEIIGARLDCNIQEFLSHISPMTHKNYFSIAPTSLWLQSFLLQVSHSFL